VNGEYLVEEALPQSFAGIDIAFFTAGETISKELAHEAVRHGAVVIDNSNAFRMNAEVPLIVPEVNPEVIFNTTAALFANPNCSNYSDRGSLATVTAGRRAEKGGCGDLPGCLRGRPRSRSRS